jgi:peptidyl-prolyl cis-trans isomerase D
MALLGRIRQYGVVMMVLIVIAVFGFLFMDVSSVGRGFGGPSNVLGSVNGNDITRSDLETYVNDLVNEYRSMGAKDDEQTRSIAWNQLVTDLIFKVQANKLGISVSEKELNSMFTGEIEQGRNQYLQLARKPMDKLNEQERAFVMNWKNLEKKTTADRISTKYINMLSKSNYAPTWMTNSEYVRNTRNYDFNYVSVLFADVPNTEVKITDEDLKAYIKENAKKYQREANVSIEYVTFEIAPTQQDSASYFDKMSKTKHTCTE